MYERILKFNPNHGPDGRFSSKPMSASAKNKARRKKIVEARDHYVKAANKATDAYHAHGVKSKAYQAATKRREASFAKFLKTNLALS